MHGKSNAIRSKWSKNTKKINKTIIRPVVIYSEGWVMNQKDKVLEFFERKIITGKEEGGV